MAGPKEADMLGAWKAWILIGVSVALVTAILLYVARAERAVARNTVLEIELQEAVGAAKANQTAILACHAANKENAAEAARQRDRALQAEGRVKLLESQSDDAVTEVRHEATRFRTDLACPALTTDLRNWLQGRP